MTKATAYSKALLIVVIVITCMMVSQSCGPNFHLRKSNAHLRKAILKGAKIKADTVYKLVPFKFPGPTYTTVLQPLKFKDYIDASDTLRIFGEEINTKLKIDIAEHCPEDCIERIYVHTDCPDVDAEVKVPVGVNNVVVSPRSFWYWFQFMVLAYALGFATRHFLFKFKSF